MPTAFPRNTAATLEDLTLDFNGDRDIAFLTRSFRLWLIGLRHNAPDCCGQVWNDFAGRFGSAEGKRALAALASSIKTIQLHARRRLRHHPPCCRYLAPDEAGFLALIAAYQVGDGALAQRRAEWLVRPSGREALLGAGQGLAAVLRDQGMAVAARQTWGRCEDAPAVAGEDGMALETVDDAEAHRGQGLK